MTGQGFEEVAGKLQVRAHDGQGFIWIAGRDDLCGEWSQAGGILRLGVGGPWYAVLPDEAWPQEEQARADIMKVQHHFLCNYLAIFETWYLAQYPAKLEIHPYVYHLPQWMPCLLAP